MPTIEELQQEIVEIKKRNQRVKFSKAQKIDYLSYFC